MMKQQVPPQPTVYVQQRTSQGPLVTALVLGVAGGATGIFAVVTLFSLEAAFAGYDASMGIGANMAWALLVSLIATTFAALTKVIPRTAGGVMITAAVVGLLPIGVFWGLSFVLLLAGGITALVARPR